MESAAVWAVWTAPSPRRRRLSTRLNWRMSHSSIEIGRRNRWKLRYRSLHYKWRHTFFFIFYVLHLSFLFGNFEDLSNKTFFHLFGLFEFQSRYPHQGSNDHYPQGTNHATFKISSLSMQTLNSAKKTVTHLGDSFAPINVSGAQKFRETASRVGQCSWCCQSGRSQAMCC